jgi:hypothetical protein
VILAFLRAGVGGAQEAGGILHGSVLSLSRPVAMARVIAHDQSGNTPVQSTITASDGSYRLNRLPPGIYTLKIVAVEFESAEVRDVDVDEAAIMQLPPIRINFAGVGVCNQEPRPDYYRLLAAPFETGAVGGTVTNSSNRLVGGATVSLFVMGKGRIASQTTNDDGRFSFSGLQARSEEYWISVSRGGYFLEELRHLVVIPGLQSMYPPLRIESCGPGRCDPGLKTIRVIPGCA